MSEYMHALHIQTGSKFNSMSVRVDLSAAASRGDVHGVPLWDMWRFVGPI